LPDKNNSRREAIKAAIDENAKRSDAPYDGLLGTLPKWVPPKLQDQFYDIRRHLLDTHSEGDVRAFLQSREELININDGVSSVEFTPPELDEYLDTLLYIKYIESLGEIEGRKACLGKDGYEKVRETIKEEAKTKSRERGGRARGEQKTKEANNNYDYINKLATGLLKTKEKRHIASIIREKTGYSKPKIYKALGLHPSSFWKKSNAS